MYVKGVGCQWSKQRMSPVSGGITLKRSHAWRPRRAFLNHWTGPGRPFQHTLKQGHLTETQVCGRATCGGEAQGWGDADGWWGGGRVRETLFTTPCENVPFYPHCTCICPYASACLRSRGSAFTVRCHETLSRDAVTQGWG